MMVIEVLLGFAADRARIQVLLGQKSTDPRAGKFRQAKKVSLSLLAAGELAGTVF